MSPLKSHLKKDLRRCLKFVKGEAEYYVEGRFYHAFLVASHIQNA